MKYYFFYIQIRKNKLIMKQITILNITSKLVSYNNMFHANIRCGIYCCDSDKHLTGCFIKHFQPISCKYEETQVNKLNVCFNFSFLLLAYVASRKEVNASCFNKTEFLSWRVKFAKKKYLWKRNRFHVATASGTSYFCYIAKPIKHMWNYCPYKLSKYRVNNVKKIIWKINYSS